MITIEWFGHMVQGEWIADDGSLLRPVTTLIGTLRLWDSRAVWFKLWNGKTYDWTGMDATILYAERIGAEVLFVFGCPPPDLCIAGSTNVPTHVAWTEFVTAVVTRYKGRIHAYEWWNEPQPMAGGYWDGTPLVLATQTDIGIGIIRLIDPAAIHVSPSMVQQSAIWQKFTDDFFSVGGAMNCDVIAFHAYGANPTDVLGDIASIRAVMQKYNIDKPIWNTEFNLGPFVPAKLEQSLILQYQNGVERVVYDPETSDAAADYTDGTMQRVYDMLSAAPIPPSTNRGCLPSWISRVSASPRDKR